MKIEYVGICDKGSVRECNQDAIFMHAKGDSGLFAVADGMGGHVRGELASQEMINHISNWWNQFTPGRFDYDFQKMMRSIGQTIEYANEIIYEKYNQSQVCGTTIVLIFIHRKYYGIIYAGDSRCYGYSKWKVRQLTIDEVWENQVGLRKEDRQNKSHPNYGKLVNAIGTKKVTYYKTITNEMHQDNVFLLCSDGLYKYCEENYLKKCLRKCKKNKMEPISQALMQRVYQNGARDNISEILIRYNK